MNAFGDKADAWEKLLPEEADCSKEKIEISSLKDKITALNDTLKEKRATLRTSMFSHQNLPTLERVKTAWLKPDYHGEVNRLKQENQDLVLENNKLLKMLRANGTSGGSRRFRKHKRRSAARRGGTASRRRYKNRK